jgi:hypothetical protein
MGRVSAPGCCRAASATATEAVLPTALLQSFFTCGHWFSNSLSFHFFFFQSGSSAPLRFRQARARHRRWSAPLASHALPGPPRHPLHAQQRLPNLARHPLAHLNHRPMPSMSFLGAEGMASMVSKISLKSALGSCMPPDCREGAQAASGGREGAAEDAGSVSSRQWHNANSRPDPGARYEGGGWGAALSPTHPTLQQLRHQPPLKPPPIPPTLVGMPRMGARRRRTPSMVPRKMRFSFRRSCRQPGQAGDVHRVRNCMPVGCC